MRRPLAFATLLVASLAAGGALAAPLDVVVNEVAWSGSATSANDEWIELYNNTGAPIDLTGWTIESNGGTTIWTLSGTIAANGFLLIERAETATSVPADLIQTMSLSNANGEDFVLLDPSMAIVDSVLCETDGGWYAGTNNSTGTADPTMERIDPMTAGNDPANWADNDGVTVNGTDSGGVALSATPGAANSVLGGGPPMMAPVIVHVHSLSASAVDVWFSEALDPTTAGTAANYVIGGAGSPSGAALNGGDPTRVALTGITGVTDGALSTLSATGVERAGGGVPSASTVSYYVGMLPMMVPQMDDATGSPTLDAAAFFTVQGWVATTVFSATDAEIYDLTGGLTVSDGTAAAALSTGDEVRISGVIGFSNGKTEMGAGTGSTRWSVLSSGNELPILVLTVPTFNAAAESFEGMLVGFVGLSPAAGTMWPFAMSANLMFEDASANALLVRIDSDTDIDDLASPLFPSSVIGVAGQFDTMSPFTDGYQVLPRAFSDFGGSVCTCVPPSALTWWCTPSTDSCVPASCSPGTDDCDGGGANGCETDILTDAASCGSCGNPCTGGDLCQMGGCVPGACPDADLDGFSDWACGGMDCDDSNANINPNLAEICGDGVDNDCANGPDDGCGGNLCDMDADGFMAPSCGGDDCIDSNAGVNPGATESCENVLDDDCDGLADLDDPECDDGGGGCGCRVVAPGSPAPAGSVLLLGAALALFGLRRRRRSPSA